MSSEPQKHAASRHHPSDGRFSRLYAENYRRIYAYCLRRTSRAAAEDAAAEVFVIAWRKLDEIPDGDRTLPWLYGVAYRVVSHQWRSRGRLRRLVGRLRSLAQEPSPDPQDQVIRLAEHQQLLDAARSLGPLDQEILRLAGWEELPHDAIAQVLGISVAAVSQRFKRAKTRLAKEFDLITGNRSLDVPKGERR